MKRVLITGATSGIGFQLVKDYLLDGWSVYACGRHDSDLTAYRLELDKATQQLLHILLFDVTDEIQTHSTLSSVTVEFDLIILNAGACEYIENGCIDVELFKRVFDVNFFGVLHCLSALQSRFSSKTHLAFMGSTASYLGLPRAEAYGSSKSALAYLAHTLAVDLAYKGVTVSLISPGFVDTPLTKKNDFPMPMLISSTKASRIIRSGLAKKKSEVHFPKLFSLLLKCIASLPNVCRDKLLTLMTRKTS